jgi:glycosyltransferase involved in cell wall biosynthesis
MQRRKLRVDRDRQYVIGNGISRALFTYIPPPPPAAGQWRLLYVGQLIREKGVFNLLDALAALRPEYDIELRLIYHVDVELQALRARARTLGLGSVTFLGGMPAPRLALQYADCHALVLSTSTEALPSVVTEAIMVGRPVISTDVGAVREQIEEFGAVVQPGDACALAQGIRQVLDQYPRIVAEAQTHSERMAARYSVEAMVRGHEELYGALVRTPVRRHRINAAFGTYLGRQAITGYARRVHRAAPR